MAATHFKGQRQLKTGEVAPVTPVWNVPQVNRLIGNR